MIFFLLQKSSHNSSQIYPFIDIIIRTLNVNKRLNALSSNELAFKNAAPLYQDEALKLCYPGVTVFIIYTSKLSAHNQSIIQNTNSDP